MPPVFLNSLFHSKVCYRARIYYKCIEPIEAKLSVFPSASEISTCPNNIHTVYNTAGCNITDILTWFQNYADRTQSYMAFKPNNTESFHQIISNIQNCVININSWRTAKMLQLNMDETEVLVLRNKSLRYPIALNKIKIDSIDILTARSVRHLDTVFECALRSEAFGNSIGKSTWFSWFSIRRSSRSLTTDAPQIPIKASVMSKIDYWNSVLYGIPNKLLNRIQRNENYAARVALRLHKFSHTTPVLATILPHCQ